MPEKTRARGRGTRESFLNVYYIQSLLESLSVSGALQRVNDPLSSAYQTWHRIRFLLGDAGPLPYDPTTPFAPLQLDGSLIVDSSMSRLKPWQDCFCAWIFEPTNLTLCDSDTLLKPYPTSTHHWKHIYEMYNILKTQLSESLTNGIINISV